MAKVKTKSTQTKDKPVPRRSVSRKYRSIRHLLETMFFKNRDLTNDEAKAAVKKEFPNTKYLRTTTTSFPWYKTHIVSKREFVTIEPPSWADVKSTKIKSHKTKGEQNGKVKKDGRDAGKEGKRSAGRGGNNEEIEEVEKVEERKEGRKERKDLKEVEERKEFEEEPKEREEVKEGKERKVGRKGLKAKGRAKGAKGTVQRRKVSSKGREGVSVNVESEDQED